MDLVVGSGPAGVAAAEALLSRGRRVTMIDAGERLEPERAALRETLAAQAPEAWREEDLARLRHAPGAGSDAAIRPYGSDFPFRDREGFFGPDGPPDWLALRPSFARGGLSNGWGAAVMPWREEDLTGWPAAARALAPHYAAVAGIAPMAARADDLAPLFPMADVSDATPLPPTAQGAEILRRLARRREALARRGVHFGQARQAVAADACRLCGQCLHGCPYGAIFNAADAVPRLAARGLDYRPGWLAQGFEEDAEGVSLHVRRPGGGGAETLRAERLFLACGVLPTTRLTLASLGVRDAAVTLLDTRYELMPSLSLRAPPVDPERERRHTLTQVFLELLDPEGREPGAHAQLYTFNDLYAADMRRRFGRLAGPLAPAIAAMSRRLVVAQTFLHSDLSPGAEIRLGADGRLVFSPRPNPRADAAAARTLRRLVPALRAAGLVPLTPLRRPGAVGASFHCGGTFPMRERPGPLESDPLGRPAGLRRVHLADASALPSIPAPTITLPMMANAHRIAATAPAA